MKKLLLSGIALGAALAFSGAANAQIKLGVAGPITGPNAAFGAQLKNGVEQAVEDINAAGGILGQKITVSVGDDVSDPKQGVSVANKFVGDGIKLVVGHFNSGVTMPASEVYAENGIAFITPSATNPKITERGLWNAFRTCGRDDQQGAVAGRRAYVRQGGPGRVRKVGLELHRVGLVRGGEERREEEGLRLHQVHSPPGLRRIPPEVGEIGPGGGRRRPRP